ncbi:kinesin-like protein KIF28P [Lingula anatina]|uniref:Kinesin-like protein 6 n=1 Tax=Lingula anatina TaxID=7574 RepID=A0A1S3I4P0_LINAN|nr:kinesin-like protein KIF28P [Lingula anatina]|eukprot:XP_013392801.1 kinesin-like protein KIF28P [Lingula anatina]
MSSDSVKVAVRVRPFNQREKNANSKLVISMRGNATTITNPQNGETKTFAFDHSYWSHDGFKENETGVYIKEKESYADQRQVYNDLGQGVLDNAWQGYNAALFAYGQTGSGKSYSMVGYGPNKGIVPITCDELFKAIDKNTDKKKQMQVTFSMLEIYNEQVRDLLTPAKQQQKGGLKVRQHPKSGFYVDGLKSVPVRSYNEIERLMDQGTLSRTTAATNMNATSSRSHMVITIRFKQLYMNELGESTTKTSEVSLVDLAGSERADSTGAEGDRLKEGAAINQSLSTLGNVISALADLAMGKKKVMVPYRDSVLTKLLQSALGGNSRTIMIAALSPAAINYDETLSTLRYADRAKKIQNKAVINESPTERLIRELKEENNKLLAMLKAQGTGVKAVVKTEELERLLQENERQMQEAQLSWEQRLEEARKEWEKSHAQELHPEDLTWQHFPYLRNVNEDPHLSGVVKYALQNKEYVIGKPGNGVSIELHGLGIQPHHAVMCNTGQKVLIRPAVQQAKLLVNGVPLQKERTLTHLDRIMLGSSSLFLYVGFPSERAQHENLEQYDFEFFQTEFAEESGFHTNSLLTPREGHHDPNEDKSAMMMVLHEYMNLLPKIEEAKVMSQEMQKGVSFEPEVKNLAAHDEVGRDMKKEVIVKVTNEKTKQVWVWSKAKFINRKFLIEDMYTKWCNGESIAIDRHHDPFWDPVEDVFLGSCHLWLQSLAYKIETNDQLDIIDHHGREEAMIHIKMLPCDHTGKVLSDDSLVLDPAELIGHPLDFVFVIDHCMGVKWVRGNNLARGVYCGFRFFGQPDLITTKTMWGNSNAKFHFKKHFSIEKVTPEFHDYLQTHAIIIELWGTQVDPDSGSASSRPSSGSLADHTDEDPEVAELRRVLKRQTEECDHLRAAYQKAKKENFKLKQQVERHKNALELQKLDHQETIPHPVNSRVAHLQRDQHGGSHDSINSNSSTGSSHEPPPPKHPSTSLDAEIAKGLKVFFKDVRHVQRGLKNVKELGTTNSSADNGNVKSLFEEQQKALHDIDEQLNAAVSALKVTVTSVIKKKKQQTDPS